MILTPTEFLELAHKHGASGVLAVTLGAIAKRESNLDAAVFNGNARTGDQSYGLGQINMHSPEVATMMHSKLLFGADEKLLLDPDVNVRGMMLLASNGGTKPELKWIQMCWYIDRDVPGGRFYKTLYERHLPEMQAAALALELT